VVSGESRVVVSGENCEEVSGMCGVDKVRFVSSSVTASQSNCVHDTLLHDFPHGWAENSPWIAKNNTVPHDAHANLVRTAFESYRYRHLASVQRDLLGLSTLERVRRSARSIFQRVG
jgi:hypothetical protein